MVSDSPSSRDQRRWRATLRHIAGNRPGNPLPPAFFFTDPARVPDPLAAVHGLAPGIGVIHRHFGLPAYLALTQNLVDACRETGRLILIGNDLELARATGAHGVHWPGASARLAPMLRYRQLIHTLSAHSARDLVSPAAKHANALFLSAVFPSNSPSAGSPLGLHRFCRLAGLTSTPVYALGGVTKRRAPKLMGADGVAGIEGF